MAYMALYRQWRPRTFGEMVGQEHVCQTLRHALEQNKVAHAYLFSGPRGTGKTTVARILAKALNCLDRQGVEPCTLCPSCIEIEQSMALDVIEIDAASNRGIDEIRDLREKVRLASTGGKYKVYIIDEVHMLTSEAFNALLKTLEDPPPGVVFILATTEAHRVPATILSRVQHFEFRRIPAPAIEKHLRTVCTKLGRDVEDAALTAIAQKSEGGLRDALSLLDQSLNQEGTVRAADIYRILGMVGETGSADLVDALLVRDYARVLNCLQEALALGRDPRQILRELLDYLREALLYVAGKQKPLRTPEMVERLLAQSEEAGLERLLAWITILLKGEGELKFAPNARLAVEMLLVQAIYEEERKERPQPLNSSRSEKSAAQPPVREKKNGAEKKKPIVSATGAEQVKSEETQFKEQPPQELLNDLTATWKEVLERTRRRSRPVHAFLLAGEPQMQNGILQVIYPQTYAFHCDMLNQPMNKSILAEVLQEVTGLTLTVEGVLGTTKTPQAEADGVFSPTEPKNRPETTLSPRPEIDAVRKAREVFGPDVVVVRDV